MAVVNSILTVEKIDINS